MQPTRRLLLLPKRYWYNSNCFRAPSLNMGAVVVKRNVGATDHFRGAECGPPFLRCAISIAKDNARYDSDEGFFAFKPFSWKPNAKHANAGTSSSGGGNVVMVVAVAVKVVVPAIPRMKWRNENAIVHRTTLSMVGR
jgi:hypothetical protein